MERLEITLAKRLLKINAIMFQPERPFLWGNGWSAPIYNDNKITLSYPDVRRFLKVELSRLILENFGEAEVVASVAMGSIAMGALVADTLGLPFVYLRNVPKDHGLENMIEGNFKPGQKVVLIEDLVSTGHNAIKAMHEMQLAGGEVLGMVAMFTYKFAEATEAFRQEGLQLLSLTNFDAMLEAALETGNITDKDAQDFELWHEDPESWTPETLKID
ncbi:MAG: orotate phosphoribosyltransferase [Muribaculaceae bacterium]|nr:orotate phosphoribosyltransferase [Muribaculaceae bacterium]MBQ5508185.1 orotate phosphoribosyltransferase [Muribaculaceae bacterium]MDY6294252.1 orotate phosphoribosyltransferase [Bacteroidales bacterium]MDY6411867.1 orotate phosphoribosyltransferase [Bacteroidales bacterium]